MKSLGDMLWNENDTPEVNTIGDDPQPLTMDITCLMICCVGSCDPPTSQFGGGGMGGGCI